MSTRSSTVLIILVALHFAARSEQGYAGIIDASAYLDTFASVKPQGEAPDERSDSDSLLGLTGNSTANASTFVRPQEGHQFRVPFGPGNTILALQDGFIEAESDFSVGTLNDNTVGSFGFQQVHDYRESHPSAFPLGRHRFVEESHSRGEYSFTSDADGTLIVDWSAQLGQQSQNFDNNLLSFDLLFDGTRVGSVFTQDGDRSGSGILELPVTANAQHTLAYRSDVTSFIPNNPNAGITGNVSFEFVEGAQPPAPTPVDPPPFVSTDPSLRTWRFKILVGEADGAEEPNTPLVITWTIDPTAPPCCDGSFGGGEFADYPAVAVQAQLGSQVIAGSTPALPPFILIQNSFDSDRSDYYGVEVGDGDNTSSSIFLGLFDADGQMFNNTDLPRNLDFTAFIDEIEVDVCVSNGPFGCFWAEESLWVGVFGPVSDHPFMLSEVGDSSSDPIDSGDSGEFKDSPGDGHWFKPPPIRCIVAPCPGGTGGGVDPAEPLVAAHGYVFETDGDSMFTEVGLPIGFAGDDGEYLIVDPVGGEFVVPEGSYLFFETPTQSFSILGIDSTGAADPSAFATFLSFDQPLVSFAVRPILAADFDKDGDVDGQDFLIWQTAFPTLDGTASSNTGDANGDGNVDGEDFLVWQNEFGSGLEGGGQVAVPEPATAFMVILAVAALPLRRWRR